MDEVLDVSHLVHLLDGVTHLLRAPTRRSDLLVNNDLRDSPPYPCEHLR